METICLSVEGQPRKAGLADMYGYIFYSFSVIQFLQFLQFLQFFQNRLWFATDHSLRNIGIMCTGLLSTVHAVHLVVST
jgi:hypothetical protein